MAIVPLRDREMPSARARQPVQPQKQEYEVGYRKPPKATQFQKGLSGNPKGRPKQAKGFKTIVREAMQERVTVRTSKGDRKITRAEALIMKTMEAAMKGGNFKAAERMLKWYQEVYQEPEAAAEQCGGSEDISATDKAILEAFGALMSPEGGQSADPEQAPA